MIPFKKSISDAAGILLLSAVFTLASCGNEASNNSTANENDQQKSATQDVPASGDQPDQTTDPDLDAIADSGAADRLIKSCHFIKKDSIVLYTDNYRKWKSANVGKNPPAQRHLGSIESFNENIVQAILSHDGVVGLRVVHGMDSQNNIHTILLGVNSKYQTVYIKRKEACLPTTSATPGKTSTGFNRWFLPGGTMAFMPPPPQDEDDGGAEMGQMP